MGLLILGGCSGASCQGEYHGQAVLPCSYDTEYRSSLSTPYLWSSAPRSFREAQTLAESRATTGAGRA